MRTRWCARTTNNQKRSTIMTTISNWTTAPDGCSATHVHTRETTRLIGHCYGCGCVGKTYDGIASPFADISHDAWRELPMLAADRMTGQPTCAVCSAEYERDNEDDQ